MIATYIKDQNDFQGDARLYRVDPPMKGERFDDDTDKYETATHVYVIVSAVVAFGQGPETYIFPADAEGKVTNWGELDGSFKGGLDHARALQYAGYTIAEPAQIQEGVNDSATHEPT